MDTKSSTVVSNQEDELLCEITGRQNDEKVTDTSNFSNTPVSDIEAPLSPVLTNDKKSMRHIARRKSRIKLLNKFSQSSGASQDSFTSSFTPLEFDTQTFLEEKEQSATTSIEAPAETSNNVKLDPEKLKSNDKDRELEERMKRCFEMQRNKKFCYNIANSSAVSLPKSENKVSEAGSSKIITNESFVSNVIVADSKNEPDFNFKIPESPVSQSKHKKQNKRASLETVSPKIEPDLNLKVCFATGSGKKINLSEKALKRAAKIFDDIIEIPCESENVSSNKNSTAEKVEISLTNTGFKTAGGNILKLSESSLKKVQTLFDDICDLSNYNETNIQKNNSTTAEVELSNSFNEDVQTLFSDSFETQSNTNSPNNKQETQFKMPTQVVEKQPNKIEDSSPKHAFSQITDTQMCLAAENAECLVEFMDSQWTPSPKNKSPLQKKLQVIENNLNKSQEDFDELSPEAEQLFGNLTVREDGTVTNRNIEITTDQESVDHAENLSTFETSIPSEKDATKSKNSVIETRSVSEENHENIPSVGFSTASGINIAISEESLKKAKQVFQDCDVIEESLHVPPKDVEENLQKDENVSSFDFATASGKNIAISEESLKKAKHVFQDCDVTEENLHTDVSSFGFATASGKKVTISEESLKKAQTIFQDCDVEDHNKICDASENMSVGKNVSKLKSSSPKKSKQIFEDWNINKTNNSLKKVAETFEDVAESEESHIQVKNISNYRNIEDLDLGRNAPVIKESLTKPKNILSDIVQNISYNEYCLLKNNEETENKSTSENILSSELFSGNSETETESSEQLKSSEEQSTVSEELFFTAEKEDTESLNCCGFIWEEALKSLKILELYKRSFKYIEKDIKNNLFYPINFTFNDIQSSKEYKNKNYKYFLRSRRRSNTITKSGITSRKSINKSPNVSELLSTSIRITRSKRNFVCDDSFAIENSLPKTRSRKRQSNTVKESAAIEEKCTEHIPEYTNKVKADNKQTIQSLEDAFLSSIENSFNKTDNFVSCESNISKEENIQKYETDSKQNKNINEISNSAVTKSENISIPNTKCNPANNLNTTKKSLDDFGTIKDEEILHKNMETPKNISSFGFATASGTKVAISEESLKKAKNIFKDCDVTEENIDKNTDTPKNISSFGFATASGKKVKISEESLKKAKNIFKDCDVTEGNIDKNADTPKDISSFGFATASGKKVKISEESLKKAKNIFKDCDVTEENIDKNADTPKDISSFGFATASGKKVKLSAESLKKAKNIFEDCNVPEEMIYQNVETPKDVSTFGFATASGKKVAISEESLKKAKHIFKDCDVTEENMTGDIPKNVSSFGFATASGKKVKISEESLKKAKNILEDCDITEEVIHQNIETPKNVSTFGFATASGKEVKISEESLMKAKNIFEDCDISEEIIHQNVETPKNISSFGFATASGKKVKISEESLKKAKNVFEDCDVTEKIIHQNVETPKNISSFGFATASGKKVKISEESLKKAKNIFEDCDVTEEIIHQNVETPKNISSFGFATASGKEVKISEESLKKAKNIFEDCDVTEKIIHQNVETPKNISSFGFATTSGKKVKISEESLKKAKNIFEDCDVTEEIIHQNVETPKNISSFGFATASGKKVKISEESLKKAKNIFEDCDISEKIIHQNVEKPKNISSFGFATASGKKVKISEESLKKAKNVFEDCDVTEEIMHQNVETPKNISSFGFATASGKNVKISEESLKKAKNVFEDCDVTEKIIHQNVETPKNISSFGFATASGKKVKISEESLTKAKNIFEDVTEEIIHQNVETPKNISSFGFATASGKNVKISEESLKKAKIIFEDCDVTEEIKSIETPKNTSSFGFATASGNKAKISEDALSKDTTMFDDNFFDSEQSSEDIPYSYTSDESQLAISTKSGFSTASGSKVNISEETLNKIKHIFDDVENIKAENSSKRTRNMSESCENNLNSLNTPKNKLTKQEKIVLVNKATSSNKTYSSPNISSNDSTPILRSKNVSARNSKKRSLGVSSCRQIDIAENNLKRAKLIFDDDTPKKQLIMNNNNLVNYSPLANKTDKPAINTPQNVVSKNTTPVSTPNKSLLNSSMSMKESNQLRCTQNLSTPKISPLKNLCIGNETMQENSSFVFREKTTGDTQKWNADLQKELEMAKLKMSVIETRMLMLNKQREIIESGSSDHRRQRPGSLFLQKAKSDDRISLQKAVCHRRPNKNTHQICLNMGFDSSILNITSENSSSLHFHVPWWPNDNRTYPAVIRTEDGAVIVPNPQNYVGITEIEQAFLAMPGVDPSLVPKNWVPNHYRWIVWKQASLERNFPDVFKSYLGVENIMNQLKYRYDREIDRAQRPAIRKIVECDDTAAKRMVLCVATIFKLENKFELELTDGWYSIKTTLDAPLNLLVERNIIKVGMKLVTQGAELLNCEGCCPLELPSNVHLQIHYNSTRRAAWHLKLGYQPNPGPLRIALRMISGNGGPVGGVSAYVARVYPISFMERSDVKITWRNQRAEQRRANQWEASYANTMENMQMKLQMELEKEWSQRAKKNKNQKLKIKDVRDVHCGKTLFQFMEESNDPDSVEELLTPAQISALQNYQTELNMERQAELSAKLRERLSNEKLQPRSVSTVLKLLLVDVQSPYHHRMLSIWRPTESHTQLLKEEIVVNIYNVTAKNNGTLSTVPRTQFEENLDFDTSKFENLTRFVLPIAQTSNPELKPFFGEFDTVGMVVSIDIQQTTQQMWLADENSRFLLIKVREGPEHCVLFDGFTPGNKIAVLNLIYQKPFKNYGESIGNHYTVLSSYPQQTYLQDFMKDFNDNLPPDEDGYLQECKNIVEEFSSQSLKRAYVLNPVNIHSSEEAKEAFVKKICGVENTQQNKSDSLTLSDEEMALIDTQVM